MSRAGLAIMALKVSVPVQLSKLSRCSVVVRVAWVVAQEVNHR